MKELNVPQNIIYMNPQIRNSYKVYMMPQNAGGLKKHQKYNSIDTKGLVSDYSSPHLVGVSDGKDHSLPSIKSIEPSPSRHPSESSLHALAKGIVGSNYHRVISLKPKKQKRMQL